MSMEAHTHQAPSESQQQFRRLLLKEHRAQSQTGDGFKRFGLNTGIFIVSTGIDVLEGKASEKVMEKVFGGHKEKKHINSSKDKKTSKVDKKVSEFQAWAKKNPGVEAAAEFIEEWGSDSLISAGTNAAVRTLTGEEHAEYASPFSEATAEWTNTILQVFKGDPDFNGTGIKVKNLVNPVNVEAALRVLSEVPLLGGAVSWTHEQLDTLMEQKAIKITNTAAAKGVLGYHIVTSKNKAVKEAVAKVKSSVRPERKKNRNR